MNHYTPWLAGLWLSFMLVLVLLAALGGFPSSSVLPFHADPRQLRFWLPLRSDYADAARMTNPTLLNTTSNCQPRFVAQGWQNLCPNTGQGILIGGSSGLQLPFTFSAWTLVQAAPDLMALVGSQQAATTNENSLLAYSTPTPGYLGLIAAGRQQSGADVGFANNTVVHVVISVDNMNIRVYSNGSLLAVRPFIRGRPISSWPLIIGNNILTDDSDDDDDYTFVGILRSVRLFNRVLSASEALTLYKID